MKRVIGRVGVAVGVGYGVGPMTHPHRAQSFHQLAPRPTQAMAYPHRVVVGIFVQFHVERAMGQGLTHRRGYGRAWYGVGSAPAVCFTWNSPWGESPTM